MLYKLSLRNAKRQLNEYGLYILTVIISVSLMVGFNSLIFSDIVEKMKSLEFLPYMIIFASIIIVVSLSWLVSYITNFMIKSRSKEFAIYMLLGIEDKKIVQLFMVENTVLGFFSFGIGVIGGIFTTIILEQIIWNLIRYQGVAKINITLNSILLTFAYFVFVFLFAFIKNVRLFQKMNLSELIKYNRANENIVFSGVRHLAYFVGSIILIILGFLYIMVFTMDKGLNVVVGLCCVVLSLLLFLKSFPRFLSYIIEKKYSWKYKGNNLVIFRIISSKLNSISSTLCILSILFTITILAVGSTALMQKTINKSIDDSVFDIAIISCERGGDKENRKLIDQYVEVKKSYTYNIYSLENQQIKKEIDAAIQEDNSAYNNVYQEFEYDTIMRYSDYQELCEILEIQALTIDNNEFLIHCIPYLENKLINELRNTELIIDGEKYRYNGVSSQAIDQNDPYGNGLYFIIIVPDGVVEKQTFLYQLSVFITEEAITSDRLNDITLSNDNIELLDRNSMTVGEGGKGTLLIERDKKYITGKWALKENYFQAYAIMISLVYVSLIFEIIGLAVLTTQLRSDAERNQRYYSILKYLGYENRGLNSILRRQLVLFFLVPIVPAVLIGGVLIIYFSGRLQLSMFNFYVYSNYMWAFKSLGVTYLLFAIIYFLYFCLLSKSYRRLCEI